MPIARAFLVREKSWVRELIASPPQTNDWRAIGLLAGFLEIAKRWDRDLETLELGASAGLNLRWDEFRYRTGSWSWSAADASPHPHRPLIETDWEGPPPALDARVRVRARAACDQNPLDIRDPEQQLRLRAYIWADQRERLARSTPQSSSRARATRGWSAPTAANGSRASSPNAHRVRRAWSITRCSCSIQRARDAQAIAEACEAATADSPLAWLRLEPEAVLDRVAAACAS